MSQPPHRIRRLILELHLPSQELAWSVQSDLARLQGERLGPIIERCCEEVNDPDRLQRIESLEVNLGTLRLESLEQDLIEQLGPRLSEALARHLRAESAAPTLPGAPPDVAASLELVAFFAKTGKLPWWADASQPRAVDQELGRLLQHAAEPLAALLRGLAGEPRALRRLVTHGDVPRIGALFDALIAAVPSGLTIRAAEVERLHAVSPSFRMESPHYRHALWTAALQTASRSDPPTDPLSFWRTVILHTALELGQSYAALVTELWAAVDAKPADSGSPNRVGRPDTITNCLFILARELQTGRVAEQPHGEPAPVSSTAPNRGGDEAANRPRPPADSLSAEEPGRPPPLYTQPPHGAPSMEPESDPSPPLLSSGDERWPAKADPHAPEALRHFPQDSGQPLRRSAHPSKQDDSELSAERSPHRGTEDASLSDEPAQLAEPDSPTPAAQGAPGPLALPLRQAASSALPPGDSAKRDFIAQLRKTTRGGTGSTSPAVHSGPHEDTLPATADANGAEAARELERLIQARSPYDSGAFFPWIELLRHLLARGLLSPLVLQQSIAVLNRSGSGDSGSPAPDEAAAKPGEASAHPRAAQESVEPPGDAPPAQQSPTRRGPRAASAALEDQAQRSADLSRALSALLAVTTAPTEHVHSADPSMPEVGELWLALLRQFLIPGRIPGRAPAPRHDSSVEVEPEEAAEQAPALPRVPALTRPAPSLPASSLIQPPRESGSHRLAADTADSPQDRPQPRPHQPSRNELAPLRPTPAPREPGEVPAEKARVPTQAQPRRPSRGPLAQLRPNLAYSETDEVYVENAGLVILWPFLASFFARLALLDRKQFVDPAALHRAVGLLGYLALGEPTPQEYQLPLAKVLCGLDSTEAFEFGPPVTEDEAEECTGLLTAAVANAPILRDMSPEAFRGTFLLRKGVLGTANGAWLLRVERVSYDVVLDRFPWTTNWIKLPWMLSELCVEW